MGVLSQTHMANIAYEQGKKTEIRHDITNAHITLCRWCIGENLQRKKERFEKLEAH